MIEVVWALGGTEMDRFDSASAGECSMCRGQGFWRDPKYFFYGVSLLACGALMFFQWTPAPQIFSATWGFVRQFGLPDLVGTGVVFGLTAFPPLFGAWFIIAWRRQGICPQCRMWPKGSANDAP